MEFTVYNIDFSIGCRPCTVSALHSRDSFPRL